MAVKIRLARFGKRKKPFYRIVAIDEHQKRNGRHLELLGSYDPIAQSGGLSISQKRIDYWLSVGAKPSETVKNLLKRK